jgi:dihydrofolate synthase/folylpolyglutamate synthase
MSRTLAVWEEYIQTLHHRSIDLTLDRVLEVARRLKVDRAQCASIAVGGTNGKGSTIRMLDAILGKAGYRTGAYTSPHLVRYNERVCLDREPVRDEALCEAFSAVERARSDVPLTYFEFGTLAALWLFARHRVEVALLEVGMGGRLDAVNILDADAAVVTSVDLDHVAWLGPDRESIGREKAGIFRAGRPAVCGDPEPPTSLLDEARRSGTVLYRYGVDYGARIQDHGWSWWGPQVTRAGLPYPAMRGDAQLRNAAGVLMVLELLGARLPLTLADVKAGLRAALAPGRFQVLPGRPLRVLDVAHNPAAVRTLVGNLGRQPCGGRTLAVFAALSDKPLEEMVRIIAPTISAWYIAALDVERGADLATLEAALAAGDPVAQPTRHGDVVQAYRAACADAGVDDRVVVFGSFYTVGAIMRHEKLQ